MKVILLKDVKGSGKAGDVVEVKEGYARNFLLPRGLAQPADAANLNMIQQKKSADERRKIAEREAAERLGEQLKTVSVMVKARAGEGGKLFGSVTAKEISDALRAKGFDIEKRKIELETPIRTTGSYKAVIRLSTGITPSVSVEVVAE